MPLGDLMSFVYRFMLLLAVTAAMPVSAAHAYLDPASTSIALQAIVGAVAAYMIAGKYYLKKFFGLFRRSEKSEKSDEQATD